MKKLLTIGLLLLFTMSVITPMMWAFGEDSDYIYMGEDSDYMGEDSDYYSYFRFFRTIKIFEYYLSIFRYRY